MKDTEVQIKHQKLSLVLWGFLVFTLILLLGYLVWLQGWCVDDNIYATFFDEGLRGFLRHMHWHFKEFNGRTVIHSAAAFVLHFGRGMTALAAVITVIGSWFFAVLCVEAPRSSREKLKRMLEPALVLFLAGILAMPRRLQNNFLYHASFYNYVFPFLFLFAMLWELNRMIRSERLLRVEMLGLLILSSLAGATTELFGLVSCGLLSLMLLRNLFFKEARLKPILLALISAGLGLVSILISPATTKRVNNEVKLSFQTIVNHLSLQTKIFREDLLPSALLALLFAAILLLLWREKRRWLSLVTCSVGAAASIAMSVFPLHVATWCYLFVLLLLIVIGLVLYWKQNQFLPLVILATAVFPMIMLFTNSIAPRNMLPLYLGILFSLSICLLKMDCFRKKHLAIPILVLTTAALVVFLPRLPHYQYNSRIEDLNRANGMRAKSDGVLCYCLDYDSNYVYEKLYPGTFYEPWYMRHWDVDPSGSQILYYANHALQMPPKTMTLTIHGESSPQKALVFQDGICWLPVASVQRICDKNPSWSYCEHRWGKATLTWINSDGISSERETDCIYLGTELYLRADLLQQIHAVQNYELSNE